MSALLWVVGLLVAGLGVLVLEVFVPSGGLLGFVSLAALVGGVATAFSLGPLPGLLAVAVVVLGVPLALGLALRWFPETPLGRRVIPPPPQGEDLVPAADRRQRVRRLVGRAGRTATDLVPWGLVEIDGETLDAVSDGGPIDAGDAVEVVAARGMAVVVRVAEPPGGAAANAAGRAARPASPAEAAPAEPPPLSRTLEDFDFDRLDAPDA